MLLKTAGFWSKVQQALIAKSMRSHYAFDMLMQTSSTQLATIEVHTPNSVGMLAIQNVTEITRVTRSPVALNNVAGVINGDIQVDVDTNLSINQSITATSRVRKGSTISSGSTIVPAAGFQNAARAQHFPLLGAQGICSFLNYYSVYDALR